MCYEFFISDSKFMNADIKTSYLVSLLLYLYCKVKQQLKHTVLWAMVNSLFKLSTEME